MSSFEFLRDFLSIFRGHPSLLHYNIFRKRALCSSNVMEEREVEVQPEENQRLFFVDKKSRMPFLRCVKGKFGMKLGLKLRRANLGLYHFESQWLFHGILLQISISNNNIMVLIGVREGREREIKCLNENILSQHHHRNENLAQGFFCKLKWIF